MPDVYTCSTWLAMPTNYPNPNTYRQKKSLNNSIYTLARINQHINNLTDELMLCNTDFIFLYSSDIIIGVVMGAFVLVVLVLIIMTVCIIISLKRRTKSQGMSNGDISISETSPFIMGALVQQKQSSVLSFSPSRYNKPEY